MPAKKDTTKDSATGSREEPKTKKSGTKKEGDSPRAESRGTKNTEEFVVDGKDLLEKVKKVIEEGNARRITIYSEEGKELMAIPLTWAAVGTLLAPVLAAVGALVAVVTKCRVVVEKK